MNLKKKKSLHRYWQYRNGERATELLLSSHLQNSTWCLASLQSSSRNFGFHSNYTRMAVLNFLADRVSVSSIKKRNTQHVTSKASALWQYMQLTDWHKVSLFSSIQVRRQAENQLAVHQQRLKSYTSFTLAIPEGIYYQNIAPIFLSTG